MYIRAYRIPEHEGQPKVLIVKVKEENSNALDYIVSNAVKKDRDTYKELRDFEKNNKDFTFSVKPVKNLISDKNEK